jgi:hypothetical protein
VALHRTRFEERLRPLIGLHLRPWLVLKLRPWLVLRLRPRFRFRHVIYLSACRRCVRRPIAAFRLSHQRHQRFGARGRAETLVPDQPPGDRRHDGREDERDAGDDHEQ